MSARYASQAPKRAVRAEDDWWPESRETVTVIVTDGAPTATGLVDQHGVPIVRLSSRIPLGFCR